MSYDIYVGDAEFNYTYNLSSLFHKHIKNDDGAGIRCLDGLTGKQAAAVLWAAFESIDEEYMNTFSAHRIGIGDDTTCIDADKTMSSRYTPLNGWGSYTSALIFLGKLLAACAANPRNKVKVH
jgi:hypothetical protein